MRFSGFVDAMWFRNEINRKYKCCATGTATFFRDLEIRTVPLLTLATVGLPPEPVSQFSSRIESFAHRRIQCVSPPRTERAPVYFGREFDAFFCDYRKTITIVFMCEIHCYLCELHRIIKITDITHVCLL